jgi:hypothetical protein
MEAPNGAKLVEIPAWNGRIGALSDSRGSRRYWLQRACVTSCNTAVIGHQHMTLKRYEILGKKLHSSLEECMRMTNDEFATYADRIAPGKRKQESHRRYHINACVHCAVLEHIGYGPVEDLVGRLNHGVDCAVEYFFGDWYRPEEIGGKALDPSWPARAILGTAVLEDALLLSGLTARWDDVTRICSSFNANIDLERQGDMIEDPDTQVYLCIASSLSSTPMPGADAMLAKVKANRSSRERRLHLLCAVWDAALAKDQKAFNKALKDSASHFLKAEAEEVTTFGVALRSSSCGFWPSVMA